MQTTAQREKLLTLEAGRGVAAFIVLMVHIHKYYFDSEEYWSGRFLGGFFAFGDMGVHYFFVLSGFVMMWAHWKDLGQPQKVSQFFMRRVIRIYPMVWLTVSVMAVLFILSGSSDRFPEDPSLLFQSLLLAGVDPHAAINFPTWTLWHENIFYLFCAAIIAAPRVGLILFCGWMLVCAVQIDLTAKTDVLYVINPINCLFGLGVASAFLLRYKTCPAPRMVFFAGLIVFLGSKPNQPLDVSWLA